MKIRLTFQFDDLERRALAFQRAATPDPGQKATRAEVEEIIQRAVRYQVQDGMSILEDMEELS